MSHKLLPSLATIVLHIWKEVFQSEHIKEDTDFFALGGDSLKAMRIIAHIGQATGKNLSMRMLFDAPTVQELVVLLEEDHTIPPYIPIRPRHLRAHQGVPLAHFVSCSIWVWFVTQHADDRDEAYDSLPLLPKHEDEHPRRSCLEKREK